MTARARAWCSWIVALLPLACSQPGSSRIIGPDGSPMSHVHCGADQGQCFRIAGELCPAGYDIQPVMTRSDGNFLVRCRVERLARTCPSAAPTLAAAAPPTFAPVPQSVAVTGSAPASNTRPITNQPGATEIDLGY